MSEKLYTEEKGEYLKNNPTWHVEDSPWKAQQILKMLKKNPIHPKTVAEVGCGAGEILNQLYNVLPVDVYFTGYEISSDALALAKSREKERLNFKLENLLQKEVNFDLLLMMDVFEHVDDYLGFLQKCKPKAKHTIFHIPLDVSVQSVIRNKLILERKSLGHLHYFMKDTALATLVDSGYEIVDYFYTAGAFEVKSNTLKSKIAFFPRKILYAINKDLAVKIFGGFSLLVLAK